MKILDDSPTKLIRVGDVPFGSCVALNNELYLVCDNSYRAEDDGHGGKITQIGLPNLRTGEMKVVSTDERVVVREAQIVVK